VTVCDGEGVSVFELLRHGPWVKPEAVLFASDPLELDGWNLTCEPIETRKAEPAKLLQSSPPSLRLAEHLQVEGAIVCEFVCVLGAEGIVSKLAGSRYISGRCDARRKCAGTTWADSVVVALLDVPEDSAPARWYRTRTEGPSGARIQIPASLICDKSTEGCTTTEESLGPDHHCSIRAAWPWLIPANWLRHIADCELRQSQRFEHRDDMLTTLIADLRSGLVRCHREKNFLS
jgi:hypothetical protein